MAESEENLDGLELSKVWFFFKLANITDSSDRKAGTEQWSVVC